MNRLKTVFLATLLMAISGLAHAAFLIEPHIGYQLGGTGDSTRSGVKYEYDYNSAQFGLKAGVQYLGFMGGFDYTFSSPDVKTKTGGATYKDSFNKKELGVFVGYELPILLRGWIGHYFDVNARDKDNAGAYASGTEFSGSATELGIGFTGLPFLSLNLMYRMVKFDELKQNNVTTALSGSAELSTSEFVIGVSLPFTL